MPPEKSLLDQADDYLATLGPAGDYMRFQMGMAEGLFAGGKSMAEGLWGLAKGGWHAATHPIATAQAVGGAASSAWNWASHGDNWSNAASAAGQGIGHAADWASHGDNWGKAWDGAADWASKQSPRDWGKIGGRATFEVAMAVGTGGAGEAVNMAGKAGEAANLLSKAGEAANLAEKGGEALNLTEKGLEAANIAEKVGEAGNAAGKAEVVGIVTNGAEEAADAGRIAREAEEAREASKAGETVDGASNEAKTCKNDPVDVATGAMLFDAVDITLPGPIPFVWERIWYSNSVRRGPLGHGWHHRYDQILWQNNQGNWFMRLADGRLAAFGALTPENDFRVFLRTEQLELRPALARGNGYSVFNRREQLTYQFEPAPLAGETAISGQFVLTAVTNNHGHAVRFVYATTGYLSGIIDSVGRRIEVHTDAQGRILTLDLPRADGASGTFAAVRYAYDKLGNMIAVTDAEGYAAHFAYQTHLLTTKTFRNGLTVYFEYDALKRCVHTWGDGNVYNGRFLYEEGHTVLLSEQPAARREYYHENGLVTHYINPLGALYEWRYNSHGDLELTRDPLGNATLYDYDSQGSQVGITYADGTRVETYYNEQGQPEQVRDAIGNKWRWVYDELGQLCERITPLGAITTYQYNGQGQLTRRINALGHAVDLGYDAQHNLTSLVTADQRRRSCQYDALGRLIVLIDAAGRVQRRYYDQLGHLVELREPNGTTRQFAYNGSGKVVRTTDGHHEVEFKYTLTGHLAQRRQGARQMQFAYDCEGRLLEVVNEQGETYRFALDALGQVVEETGFDGITRWYEYDAAGRMTYLRRPAGRSTAYTYDATGRVTEVVHNASERTNYSYQANGELLTATTDETQTQFEHDAEGRVVREIQNGYEVWRTYNAIGQRLKVGSSLGAAINLDYDVMGQVRQVQAGAWQSIIERDAEGLEVQRQLSGGVQTTWQRDVLGRPVTQHITQRSELLVRRRHYQWQDADQITALEDSLTGSAAFEYDTWGNLTATRYADGSEELRQTDSVGNLFRTPGHQDRQYGRGGQLREADGTRYYYDAEGNLTSKVLLDGSTWHYTWNGAGQLAAVKRPDNYSVVFAYDALGRRVSKRYRGQITKWVWDGDKPLHEWTEVAIGPERDSASTLLTWLFEENNFAPTAKLTAQAAYSIVVDHLGTPLELYDERGTKTWQARLDSYGAVREGKGKPQDCPFRYQGQYEDVETGLYYNRFRYFDPEVGHYISQDPLSLGGGTKLYAYSKDPLQLIDPFGLAVTYGPLDSLGRPTGIFAELTSADLRPTGSSPPTLNPPGWEGGAHPFHQQRSHLLADTLGGSGSDGRNLVTLTDGANHPGMSTSEGQVRRYLRNNPTSSVTLEVTPHYTGNNLVPDRVTMYALDHNGNVLVDRTVTNGLRQNTVCRGLGC
ncbi:MAG: RHS repeat-associated core domain-containing protein [Janthinobacterium lividum]